jgi:kynurenine formamidase
MRKICLSVLVICFVLSASLALAGQPFGTNWGKWGPRDQIGAWNYITPEKIAEAATLVKKGKVFNLAIDLKPNQPGWEGRFYRHTFDYILPSIDPKGGAGASDDAITMHQQYSTQWDGFPHFFFSGKMYNGYDATTKVTAMGAFECSIHHLSDKVVTRGVLLDMAKYKGVPNVGLEKGYIITPADLDGCCKAQNVEVRTGDVLCVRTGWLNVMRKWTWPFKTGESYAKGEPGLGLQACKWIKDKQICAVAFDNLAVEAIPFDPEGVKLVNDVGFKGFPVHVELLVHQGVSLGEIWDFEELAKDCEADGVYEFMLIAPPLRIVGGVGSPLSPLAIK